MATTNLDMADATTTNAASSTIDTIFIFVFFLPSPLRQARAFRATDRRRVKRVFEKAGIFVKER